MSRTRRTEQRTLQDLGLIRDERDRELERAARSRSCSVLVTVSLLMAAACLLQGNSAWAPLLALTPLSWAVQHFSRFAADSACTWSWPCCPGRPPWPCWAGI